MKQTILITFALSLAATLSAQETAGTAAPSPTPTKHALHSVGITVGPTVGTGIHSIPHLLREFCQVSALGFNAGICGTYETLNGSRTDFAAEWSLTYGYHHTTLHSTAVDGTTYDWNIPRHTLSARVAPQLVIHTRCPLSLTVGTGLGFSTENLHDISSKSAYYLIENIFNYSEIDLNLGASYPLTDRLTVAAEIIYDILTYETAYSELPTLFDHFNCQLLFSLRYTFKRTSSNNP